MQVIAHTSPAEWLAHVEPLLLTAEAENNLLLGLGAQAASDPERFAQGLTLLHITDGRAVVGAALVNQYNLVLSRQSDAALNLLSEHLAEQNIGVPGVIGPDDIPGCFLRDWFACTGTVASLRRKMRIHACHRVEPLTAARGKLRRPHEEEIPTLANWRREFHMDAGIPVIGDDHMSAVQRMHEHRQLFVWDNDAHIVSFAAIGRRTPHSAVVTLVYTPPEQRGRGYATSCVAELTRTNLAAGADFCCLYTDLANPISNAIYARIGYHPVCDSAWWSVASAGSGEKKTAG